MPGLALATTLALAAAYPPSGIYGPPAPAPRATPSFNPGVGRDVRDIRSDIDNGRDRGQLSRKEARALKREASLIACSSGATPSAD